MVQLVGQLKPSWEEVAPLPRDVTERIEPRPEREGDGAHQALVAGREEAEIWEVMRRQRRIRISFEPLSDHVVSPIAQPARRVDRFRRGVRRVSLPPTRRNEQPFGRQPRREACRRLRQSRDREPRVHRVVPIPDCPDDAEDQTIDEPTGMASVSRDVDHARLSGPRPRADLQLYVERVLGPAHHAAQHKRGIPTHERERARTVYREVGIGSELMNEGASEPGRDGASAWGYRAEGRDDQFDRYGRMKRPRPFPLAA